MRSLCWALLLSLLAVLPAGAQETRGNISGTVQDAEGVVPGATVKITSVDTGASQQLVTNSRGYFEAPLLQPGNYSITVEMAGFKTMTRSGIVLAVGQQLQVPITLEVGGVNEQVTVTATAPLLDTNSVSSGANFDTRLVDGLPMFSNMPIMLTRFAPGVNPNDAQSQVSQGFVDGTTSAAGTAVGNVGSNTYTIDGATNNGTSRRIASSPNSDMIQEMRVESSNFDASVGHGTGLQISMMTRAGTNALRGTVNYQYWTNSLNSLNASQQVTFDARAKSEFEKGRSHNIAFTAGGPVVIPGVVDGRGKLFFFANYSHVNDFIPGKNQGTNTIPANQAHLEGNFSDLLLLPNPAQYQIYDPLTARTDPNNANRVIRDPFPGNIIPRNRIFNADGSYKNPLMGLYARMVPQPNQNFISPTQAPNNNYYRGGEPDSPVSDLYGGRLDYNHSASDRFFFRGSGSTFLEGVSDWTYQATDPTFVGLHSIDRSRYTWSFIGNWTHATGSTVFDTQFATNRFNQVDLNKRLSEYKPSDVGLPTYIDSFCQGKGGCMMPVVTIGGYQGMGNGSSDGDTATNIQGQVTMTTIKGAHTLRSGVDIRQAQRDRTGGGNRSGALTFNNTYTQQASDQAQLTPSNLGLSLAAFELGLMSSASIVDNSPASFVNQYYSAFAQDSWRVGSNLTLNAGLRFEYENGIREVNDRMMVGFDENATLAITQAAEAAYIASGVQNTAGMLPSIRVRGGGTYATDPGQDGTSWGGQAMWMPRFGAAYKLGARTVVKGGYGIYYDTLNAADFDANQLGYNVTTNNNSSIDLGRTFPISMFDPFPVRPDGNRFEVPLGDDLGVDTVVGSAYDVENVNREHARQQRWRVSIQRELTANLGVEIAYNGSYSDNIGLQIKQDYLPEQYWNSSNVRDVSANTFLTANVTNPFRIQNFTALQTTNPVLYQRMAASSFFTSQTIQRNRLLRAFPQISTGNGLRYNNLPLGESKVHALEISVNRRYSNGLSGTASFSATRIRSNRTVEEYDRVPTLWQGDNNGRPYRFTGGAVYELPFGNGKKWMSEGGVLASIVGGWQVSGTYEYQPGPLLNWNNLFFYGNLDDIAIDNPQIALQADGTIDRTKPWLNTEAGFEKDPAKIPAGFQKRTFPFRVDGVRGYAVGSPGTELEFAL